MSNKELSRLGVMKRLKEKRMRQREAAAQLGISVQYVVRLLQEYRDAGVAELISKRVGRPSFKLDRPLWKVRKKWN